MCAHFSKWLILLSSDQKSSMYLVLVCCIISPLSSCRPIAHEWISFTSPQGDFTVSVPHSLLPVAETHNPPPGGVPRIRFQLPAPDNPYGIYFGVERLDFPKKSISLKPSSALDSARDTAVSFVHGRLVSESPISLGDVPGREIQIASGDRKAFATQRMYVVDDHLYVIFAVEQGSAAANTNVLRFLNSFRLGERAIR